MLPFTRALRYNRSNKTCLHKDREVASKREGCSDSLNLVNLSTIGEKLPWIWNPSLNRNMQCSIKPCFSLQICPLLECCNPQDRSPICRLKKQLGCPIKMDLSLRRSHQIYITQFLLQINPLLECWKLQNRSPIHRWTKQLGSQMGMNVPLHSYCAISTMIFFRNCICNHKMHQGFSGCIGYVTTSFKPCI